MATTNPSADVHDLIQLARESLRIVDELHRSRVPVSATTHHALLNEAAVAIEAVRSTLGPSESLTETFQRLAPGAPAPAALALPGAQRDEAPPAKRARRTKAEMEAAAAAASTATSPESEGGLSNVPAPSFDAAPAAASVEAAASTPDSAQPGFDREKAEAVLKKTGDEFRAAEARRLERAFNTSILGAKAVAAQVEQDPAPATSPADSSQTPYGDWKEKLHLAPKPEDMPLPWKNGEYAGKKFSDCTIRDLEIILANYVKGVEGEPDPEKREARALWLKRSAAWHRYRFDLLLVNAGEIDLDELRAEYQEKASAQGPSASMQLHRKLWLDRVVEIAAARKAAGA